MDDLAQPGQRIVSEASALRRLPAGMAPGQHFVLSAISVSAQMVDHAFAHLESLAAACTVQLVTERRDDVGGAGLLLEAWSLVDGINRLRVLVSELDGWDQSPDLIKYREQTEEVWAVRNTYQHLATLAPKLIEARVSGMGSLSWVGIPDPAKNRAYGCAVVPGSIWQDAKGVAQIETPGGRTLRVPVDLFRLVAWRGGSRDASPRRRAGRVVLQLSELVAAVYELVKFLEECIEASVQRYAPAPSTLGSDLSIVAEFATASDLPHA